MAATEHEQTLTRANVTLLQELNHQARQLVVAGHIVRMLRSMPIHDWNEAQEALKKWDALQA